MGSNKVIIHPVELKKRRERLIKKIKLNTKIVNFPART